MSPGDDHAPAANSPHSAGFQLGDLPVSQVNPLDDHQWDSGLATLPGASFFHGSAWARVLHDTYGFTPVYFTLDDPGHPSALLPVMEVDSWLTGKRGVSLPFTDECARLCREAASGDRLWRRALDQAQRHRNNEQAYVLE